MSLLPGKTNCISTYLELVINFTQFIRENVSFATTSVNLLLEDLGSLLEHLYLLGLALVTDTVPLVVEDYALTANVNLVVLAEELGALVWMLQAILLGWLLLLLELVLFLLLCDVFLTVEVVQYGEILDELLDVRGKVAAARWTGQNV